MRRIGSVIAFGFAVALGLGLGLALAACAAPPGVASDEQAATACADGPTVNGIDVSVYETSIDWTAVHAAGVAFAFVRASDGTQYPDPSFAEYWAGARAAGVIRGAYQYFRPAEDPIAQADLLIAAMGSLEPGDLPPVIDVEVSGGLSQADVATAVRTWLGRVTAKLGVVPFIYAGLYSWPELTDSADMTASPLWVAQYTSAACPDIPAPWTRWMFWQDTSSGSVAGIPGQTLDLDLFNGTLADLHALTVSGTCGDGTCSGNETSVSCPADCPPCGQIAPAGGVIDDGDACFVGGGPPQYLRRVTDAGDEGDLIWTHATAAATEVSFGQWNLSFAAAGRYAVEAYTAHSYAGSRQAGYRIEAGDSELKVTSKVTIDQTAVDGWQSLGEVEFAAGGGQSIHLGDNTGEAAADNVQLVFDAVRLTRVDDAPPPNQAPDMRAGCSTTGATAATGLAGATGWLVVIAAGGLIGRARRRRGRGQT